MTPVEQVLAGIRAISTDEHDKGDRFERLMLHAFQTDRTFRQQFSRSGCGWTGRSGQQGHRRRSRRARPRRTPNRDPVQVLRRHRAPDDGGDQPVRRPLGPEAVVASHHRGDHRLWSANAEKSSRATPVPIERIGIDDLNAMTVDWSSYNVHEPNRSQANARHELWSHQAKAVDDVRVGFEKGDRGKLIMACGTGKTFTALRIAEEHAGAGKSVLFLAPSIALVAQSLKE